MKERYTEYALRNRYSKSDALQNWVAKRIVQNFIAEVKVIPASSSVLEFGCGLGRIAQVCTDLEFMHYAAVEPNSTLANEARASVPGILVDENYLPFISEKFVESFDLALSFHVLEHAPNPYEARDWVEAMATTLKPGGALLISGPDIRDYKNSFWDSDWSHGYPLTPARVSQILTDLGLHIICSTSIHFGSKRFIPRFVAKMFAFVLPTRIIDSITVKLFGRPLATGLKIALLWGVTFVVAQKSVESKS